MSMRIVFAGTPAPAGIILQALIDAGINVDCVITRPDAIVGRKRIPTPSVCAKVAEDCGIQQIKTTRLNPLEAEQEWAKKLLCERFDLGVIVAFGCLLKDPFYTGRGSAGSMCIFHNFPNIGVLHLYRELS